MERPLVGFKDVVEDFFFTRGGKDLAAVIVLDSADLRRQPGTLVDQLEDLEIELVDLRADVSQGCGHLAAHRGGRSVIGFARHKKSHLGGIYRNSP